MDPLLIVIALSALVTVFPLLNGLWQRIDKPKPVVTQPTDTELVVPPVMAPGPIQPGCMRNLLELAKCLPEDEAQKLVQKYAAVMVMKELGK